MSWKEVHVTKNLRTLLQRIDVQKSKLDAARPIPAYALRNIKESISLEWTYNSNSIEGNTLTLLETKMVLEDGLTVSGKSLREHFEAVNHRDAIDYVEVLAASDYRLQKRDIFQVHALVLDKIDKDIAGRLRTGGVRISGANFTPPDALVVDELLDELITWFTQEDLDMHPVVKATIFHHRFVWIHPFFDGNGRTTRLISNLLTMAQGFPPAVILTVDRKKYYAALNNGNTGNYNKLVMLVAQAQERSLTLYLASLEDRNSDYQSIQNIVSEPGVPYGQEYVSLLARQGKIEAYKEGRVWFTKREAIEAYRNKRQRKR